MSQVEAIRLELVQRMSEEEHVLNSPEVQQNFQNSTDPKVKSDFVKLRISYSAEVAKLKNAILEKIAIQLQNSEPQLKSALDNLNAQLESLQNQVAILNAIKNVTNLVANIVSIV